MLTTELSTSLLSKKEIFLQKRLKVLPVQPTPLKDNTIVVAAMMRNIESLGFIFSEKLFKHLGRVSVENLTRFYADLVPLLKKMVGAHVNHQPMYPNFPQQVMDMSEVDLYLNAILHYWFGVLPETVKEERLPLLDADITLKVIDLGTVEEFHALFTTLVGANGSLSEYDKKIVEFFIDHLKPEDLYKLLPAKIPYKENLCLTVAFFLQYKLDMTQLLPHIKTATDVLRIAVGLSGGDISLAEKTKFKRWTRAERRLLLSFLNAIPSPLDDLLRYKNEWKVLFHGLHVGDYTDRYPKVYEYARILRQDIPYQTYNAQVEAKIQAGLMVEAADLLQSRPGDFARRLDKLFRGHTPEDNLQIAEKFIIVAP
jgi:hypothetical protein